MIVPFVDLRAQYLSIKEEIDAAIARVINNTSFILGREVEAFEAAFAEYTGARFCVGLNSGTAAIQLAVMACGMGEGCNRFFVFILTPAFKNESPFARFTGAVRGFAR